MKLGSFSSFLILYLEFATAESQKSFNALIFDRSEKSLIQIHNEIPNHVSEKWKWASACPASEGNKDDEEFNEKKSFSKNALFVQGIYDAEDVKKLQVEICDKPFKLSIALVEERPLYYEFGYDIYFKPSDSEKFKLSDKGKYKSLDDSQNAPKLLKELFLIPIKAFITQKKTSQGETSIIQDTEKGFTWIPLFKMKNIQGHPFKIKYEIRENNRDPFVGCQSYDLGKEMFKNINVDSLYSKDVQEKAFKGVSIPERLKCEMCFEKWLLIPADQFQFGSSELPMCSNMATIPIWSSIVKGVLENLDRYLYTLSRVSDKPLSIVAGIHKFLRLPSKYWGKKSIVLKNNGVNIHVPKIIYKLVTLKVSKPDCKKGKTIYCWYGVLIVIHNDPTFKTSKRICYDESTKLGWEDIMYDNPFVEEPEQKSKYIYVCRVTPHIIKFLGLKYDKNLSINDLSLTDFPQEPYEAKANPKKSNMKKMISQKLKREFPHEDEPLYFKNNVVKIPKNYVIERPPLVDDGNS